MQRKSNPALWSDVSILILAVLAITAFLRGAWQFWMLLLAFTVWIAFAVPRHFLPALLAYRDQNEARKLRLHYEEIMKQQSLFPDTGAADSVETVLLRHVNHRISAYLQAAYPEATWEWCSENPEQIAENGGTGRIRLHDVPDYNFAEVSLDRNAAISCQLLKVVPLDRNDPCSGGGIPESAKTQIQEIDPHIWYERKGKTVLTNLIADLDSRGHNSLTIQDDGRICIQQASQEVTRPAFEAVPSRTYWPRLVKVLERDGIASSITSQGLLVSW